MGHSEERYVTHSKLARALLSSIVTLGLSRFTSERSRTSPFSVARRWVTSICKHTTKNFNAEKKKNRQVITVLFRSLYQLSYLERRHLVAYL